MKSGLLKIITPVASLLFMALPALQAQNIHGYVKDKKTGEVLIGASIYIAGEVLNGTVSNSYGFYSIYAESADTVKLICNYMGYVPDTLHVTVENRKHDFYLREASIDIKEVGIVHEKARSQGFPDALSLPAAQVKALSRVAIEPDILKVMQLLPGIQAGKEGSSGLHVRGGSPDQNLYLLDDVPLYYVNHLGGLLSTFDPDAINNMTIYKGGFPARYGGRISSVLDLRMKDGNNLEKQKQYTLGTLSSKLLFEGPVKENKSSYLFSLRRCNYDLFLIPIVLFDSNFKTLAGYTFTDGYFKFNTIRDEKNRFYFSAYGGRDIIYLRSWGKPGPAASGNESQSRSKFLSRLQWGNVMGSARWNHIFGPALFANTTLSYTSFFYRNFNRSVSSSVSTDEKEKSKYIFSSGNQDIILKTDMDYFPLKNLRIKWGGGSIFHVINPGENKFDNVNTYLDENTSTKIYNTEFFTYGEGIFKTDHFSLHGGVRLSNFNADQSFFAVQPRLLFTYKAGAAGNVSLTATRMVQEMHLLSGPGEGIPTDIWIPSTQNFPPMQSDQVSLSYQKEFFPLTPWSFDFSVIGYRKEMRNLVEVVAGYGIYHLQDALEEKVETDGKGLSHGVEVLLHKKTGALNGWIGYTFARHTRQFENINGGKPFPYRYDQPHDLSIVLNYKLNKKAAISATWVYGSGYPVTVPVAKYPIYHDLYANHPDVRGNNSPEKPRIAYAYPDKNTYRLPAYHKLDIGYQHTREHKKGGLRTITLNIYNVYNRNNPFYLYYQKNPEGDIKAYQISLFPFMPSVSYTRMF